MEQTQYIDAAEVAKIIRQELKASFPGYKFSVKTSKYSGGSSISVNWTDGPTKAAVSEVIGWYHGATFDGMIDLKEYHKSEYNGKTVRFMNDFLFLEREYSDKVLIDAVTWWKSYWIDPSTIEIVPNYGGKGIHVEDHDNNARYHFWQHVQGLSF